MKFRTLIIVFCCSIVLCLVQFTTLFAQCEILGEVVDSPVNGDCGVLVHAVQDGSIYHPIEDLYDLQPGQVITFSVDSVGPSQDCNNAMPVVLTCFELISNDCADQGNINLSTPCSSDNQPVCGCDGQTYTNACQAENWYGIIAWTPGACAGDSNNCVASFMYTFLDEQTVLFFNTSQGYTDYEWDFGNGTSSFDNTMSFVKEFESGNASVCLRVWNNGGCQDEYCLDIAADAPEEMCNASECVWPGDTNGDDAANNFDVLNIGIGIGAHGFERPFFPYPDDPIAWAPNFGYDWASWVGPINFKHLDCNGDGLIEESDLEAIHSNYSPDFDFESTPQQGAPSISIEFDQSTIIIDETTPEFVVVSASIYMGSEALPFIDLHGLAFNVSYPYELTKANGVSTELEDDSFLGHTVDIINFSHDLYSEGVGRYDAAISRRNGPGMSGFGKVAKVNFVVNADIIEGFAAPETSFDIIMEQVTMVNTAGETISFGLEENTDVITFINSNVSGTIPIAPENWVKVFPNPTEDILHIVMEQTKVEQLDLLNAQGQSVWYTSVDNASHIQLDISDFEPGLYLLRFASEQNQFSRKIIIK